MESILQIVRGLLPAYLQTLSPLSRKTVKVKMSNPVANFEYLTQLLILQILNSA
jgi:hypothetical protein